jgi:hypothetical protein
MSGKLYVHFAPDMPQATVEVVAPDLETVGRLWLGPGITRDIDVPSEGSFLRVHLASGQVITLKEPGSLDRKIDLASLESHLKPRAATSFAAPAATKNILGTKRKVRSAHKAPTLLQGDLTATLSSANGVLQPPNVSIPGRELVFAAPPAWSAYVLSIEGSGVHLRVRIPGFFQDLIVRIDGFERGRLTVVVRVRTVNSVADTISGYMTRGDLYSAAAMTDWTDKAEDLLEDKTSDPFGAAVGAYLLLRLQRFDLLRTWARNLAEWFPHLADGNVAWAWQQILTHGDEAEIRRYFNLALAAGLPVFTEGLRLLRDGLRLLGSEGQKLGEQLNSNTGAVLWNSPFTATTSRAGSEPSTALDFDIDYESTFRNLAT